MIELRDGREIEPPTGPERKWPPGETCKACGRVVWEGHVCVHGRPVPCRPAKARKRRKCHG